MRRLTRYLEGLKMRAALMILVATGNAACQTGGWLLVRVEDGFARYGDRKEGQTRKRTPSPLLRLGDGQGIHGPSGGCRHVNRGTLEEFPYSS